MEGRSKALVVPLEGKQSLLGLLDRGEVIGSQSLALKDREVDLDLIEPAGVDGAKDGHEIGYAA